MKVLLLTFGIKKECKNCICVDVMLVTISILEENEQDSYVTTRWKRDSIKGEYNMYPCWDILVSWNVIATVNSVIAIRIPDATWISRIIIGDKWNLSGRIRLNYYLYLNLFLPFCVFRIINVLLFIQTRSSAFHPFIIFAYV